MGEARIIVFVQFRNFISAAATSLSFLSLNSPLPPPSALPLAGFVIPELNSAPSGFENDNKIWPARLLFLFCDFALCARPRKLQGCLVESWVEYKLCGEPIIYGIAEDLLIISARFSNKLRPDQTGAL